MRILSNLSVSGLLGLNSVADANTDTDKFLVLDSSGIVRYRTGAEVFSDIGAGGAAAYTSVLQHTVKAGEALTKGQAVYVTSADGTNMIVSKASNATEATSSKTLGLIAQNLATNDQGFVVTEGLLAGIDTSTANAGDPVWLGTGGNLLFGLANKPYAPTHMVFIGIVTRVQQNNGEIFVKVQNGFELQELHNVQITSTPSDNTVLAYETSTSLYKMKSIPTLLGYTPTTNARNITINGTTYDLSADRSWSVGTHTGNLTTGYVPKATGITSLTDSLIYDNGSAIGINTASPYESSAFKLDVNGGLLIKNTSGTTAQLVLINSNPATGGNNGFVQLSAGGNTATAFGQWQTYYGMSVAAGALRLQPAGGQVLIGTTTTSAFLTDINGTLRVSGQLTLGSTISNNTYVYTMPGASGTLALVSQIPSLSGYLTIASADATYLTQSSAASIYLSQTSASNTYLTISGAASTYLSQASASNTYLTISGASSIYLSQTNASNTYLTINGASITYLSQTSASNTYLTINNAASNYVSLTSSYANPSWITSLAWSKITGAPAFLTSYTETDTLASVTGRGATTSTLSAFNGGLTTTKTGKSSYAIQIKGAFYGAPRLQLYDLAADSNAFLGLGVDMSTAPYEFSNYFPRYAGMGRWSVGSWAGDFGSGQYVSGYNEKLWINESSAAFNISLNVVGAITQSGNQVLHAGNYSSYNSYTNLYPTNLWIGNAIYFGGGNNYFNWDGARINSNVGIQSSTDMRAPIFYDSNDTSFYLDPNGSSVLNATVVIKGNDNQLAIDGTSGYQAAGIFFREGGNNRWELYHYNGNFRFYNYTTGSEELTINNSGGFVTARTSFRAPIFYDSNDTTYYLDPNAGTSLNIAGKITTAVSNGTILSHASMTDAFGYNNSYGTYIGSVVGGTYYLYANGTFFDAGTIRTLIHSGNFSSYALPLSGGTMSGAITTGTGTVMYIGNQNVSTSARLILNWHTDSDYQYVIGKRAGAWTQPMDIAFYTGIRYHAHQAYNGHIFYVNGYDTTEAFSIGRGDSNVRVNNSLFIGSRTSLHQVGAGGGENLFTGLDAPSSANGRAQFVLASAYSDLVIASSQANGNHGSTLTFATYNPSNAGDYRKFVINQGNWGARAGFLDFGFADAGGRSNPHLNINATDDVMSLDGYSKRVGINQMNPGYNLDVSGNMRTTGRYYSNEWIEMNNHSGLYSPLNGAHFYPNNGTYGSWRSAGNRNGWNGIEFDGSNGNVVLMINPSSNTTGFHNNSYGWQFYWEGGSMYVGKNSYGANMATVLDSSNYSNWAQPASSAINTSNIGSQSVNYASSSGTTGTVIGRSRGSFTVGGSTSTFYPVAFQIGSGATDYQGISVLQIERGGYDEPGYSSTGFGTFHCRIRAKADGWGYGASYIQVEANAYTIPMLADVTQQNQTSQLIVWLRGGQSYRWYDVEGGWSLNFSNPSGGNYVTHSGNVTYTPTSTNTIGGNFKYQQGWGNNYISGTFTAGGDVVAFSDARVKDNLRPIENVLDRICKSRGVMYDRTDVDSKNNIGFIAQELEDTFPELVTTDGDRKSVKYQNATAVLFEAIKEQQKLIEDLKSKLDAVTK